MEATGAVGGEMEVVGWGVSWAGEGKGARETEVAGEGKGAGGETEVAREGEVEAGARGGLEHRQALPVLSLRRWPVRVKRALLLARPVRSR